MFIKISSIWYIVDYSFFGVIEFLCKYPETYRNHNMDLHPEAYG